MRTTVSLDNDIERTLRETALRTHRPFKRVLNEMLRSAIAAASPAGTKQAKRFTVKARDMGLLPGIDPIGFSKLADDLEAAAFLDSTKRLKAHIAATNKRKK
ncbi:MAG: hypothetical protein FWD61_07205 [Phycisphaerales bacterium]|nr:hypothetical protein [Phycisphaerales bacterium]